MKMIIEWRLLAVLIFFFDVDMIQNAASKAATLENDSDDLKLRQVIIRRLTRSAEANQLPKWGITHYEKYMLEKRQGPFDGITNNEIMETNDNAMDFKLIIVYPAESDIYHPKK